MLPQSYTPAVLSAVTVSPSPLTPSPVFHGGEHGVVPSTQYHADESLLRSAPIHATALPIRLRPTPSAPLKELDVNKWTPVATLGHCVRAVLHVTTALDRPTHELMPPSTPTASLYTVHVQPAT